MTLTRIIVAIDSGRGGDRGHREEQGRALQPIKTPETPPTGPDEGAGGSGTLASPARADRQFNSRDLFGGVDEVVIEHEGAHYRLRRTSKGKLILTK